MCDVIIKTIDKDFKGLGNSLIDWLQSIVVLTEGTNGDKFKYLLFLNSRVQKQFPRQLRAFVKLFKAHVPGPEYQSQTVPQVHKQS